MLAENLKVVQASTAVFALKTQSFHWNCEGSNFPQYHKLFDEIYTEVYGSLDRCAEFIRTLDAYAPASLIRYRELSVIEDQPRIPRAELMIAELYRDNGMMIECLNGAFMAATNENQQGIANFLAERLDAHGKHGWFLRSILKTERE
jgi:starvation-inducible DNA-binding protein